MKSEPQFKVGDKVVTYYGSTGVIAYTDHIIGRHWVKYDSGESSMLHESELTLIKMTPTEIDNIKIKIKHLKELLAGRQAEYIIFGGTNEDLKQDSKIIAEIKTLEDKLKAI
jgi:hypothetical protein